MIRFEGVSKIYSTDVVLKNISWEIKKGEKVGLVGSNGAGKSTQFKILIGEEEQTSGTIIKEGNPKIAHLKQEFDCNLNFSVRQELESSFKDIQIVAVKLLEIENKMKSLDIKKNSDELEIFVNQLAKYQAKFEALGGYKMQSDVEKILPKLGFSTEDADKLVGNFSGGWQMKVALGKIILQKPDLLLLDEPTNHLDLETIFWLEEYLSSLKIAVIIISHDRYFLDKLCKKIIFVDRGTSETYNGNYSFFVEQKSLNEESQNKAYQLQQKEIELQKRYIDRFRASATRSSQAKSREKQLKKISKIEAPIAKSKSPVFNFPECPRSGKLVLNIKNLSHSFEDKILFLDINLKISSGEKIAILGPNGCGKSTLLKIIMKKLSPEIGEINLGKHNIITSYYEQNQAEALSLEERVIDLICNKSPEWSQKKVRTFLGGFGFQNETVFKYIKQLSGGEKARLALALMIINPSNFLLLDEPTNHLDLQSKENLELAIKNYKGSLLIISHDRYFISKVANRIIEIKDSKLFSYNGNYEYFLEKTQSHKKI
ncbi:lysophospholipase [Prochlorococcus marinus str. XMU1401]|uniref:ABC-F family ATP-binding cassette domain-containing protein n=1 Tax=Prochlorococcus marinus str. XMU1401 TaxID=2052594 RepID=A0A8I1X222_PROMR|nr:ABC-F family ATP-binding cassette domain-containing protein [Prochlorococcus marinus]MBO8221984.1 ABC-F family ATP-binding cassette domain-containing protein [Prochlorococcus marinus str. XMU1401]MBW3060364.1 lysophospholipase [Prochlorococcus marinus str. XMU1401E]MCQ9198390.1 ATP-binding cassette domain-containing protein [Prochlorococcus marinus XMU1429]PJC84500.1 lysophospholipase [Prochlorococcus marinus str. XMU1401]